LKPYTDKTIQAMAKSGVKSLDVVCPGFSADCLETLEEIDEQNREIYLHAGGEQYRYIPALNDRPDHMRAITELILRHLQGWVEPPGTWSAERAAEAAAATDRRAAALRPH
jgi:ferrochelatase